MERRTHGITQFSVYLGSISELYDKESEKIKKKIIQKKVKNIHMHMLHIFYYTKGYLGKSCAL